MVMSATSSVSTPGVLVTVMPRVSAVATSMWSTPLPKLAISLRFSPACESTDASMRSVIVGTSTSADFAATHELGLAHRAVVDVEARIEQLAHARLDALGQAPRDHDERLFLRGRHRPSVTFR